MSDDDASGRPKGARDGHHGHHGPVSTRTVPRFAGVSTFLRLPHHPDDAGGADVAVIGAPFDGGTTFRPGARFGPRAVREASALSRGFSTTHGVDLSAELSCVDGGDVACIPMDMDRTQQRLRDRVAELDTGGSVPVVIGGDHSVSLGCLRALAERHGPLGLVHFDAHSDTFGPAWDVDLHHGTVFRNAMEEGLLRPRDVVQIGIRGPLTSAADLDYAAEQGFRVVGIEEVKEDLSAVVRHIEALSECGKFYVSFDMDFLDPAYAPGTGTPVPGGATTYEAQRLLRALARVEMVGFDVVEISPDHDRSGNTALVAVTVLCEMLAALAAQRRSQRDGSNG